MKLSSVFNKKSKLLYDNFESIDWMVDFSRERLRIQFLKKFQKSANLLLKLKILFDRIAGWLIILWLGIIAGLTAKFVSLGIGYFVDLREGLCTNNFLLNREQCCWNSPTSFKKSREISCKIICDEWKTWAEMLSLDKNTYGGYLLNYIVFVFLACIYTFFSSSVVAHVSPYAAGGGIAEVVFEFLIFS